MNTTKIIKPLGYTFMVLVCDNKRPYRFLESVRSLCFIMVLFFSVFISSAQNRLEKQLSAAQIETITINGDQIFNISVSTSKTNHISVISTLDGEYQNDFQIVLEEENHTLYLSLEHVSLFDIPDDKRSAHKVIAATLQLVIPEKLAVNIISDIGSVDLEGDFKSLYIELLSGKCNMKGKSNIATINTIEGDIDVIAEGVFEADSNHGEISIDALFNSDSIWKLKSIKGNITVAKPN
ncbi:hypothetical protein [Winogradskyella undariae]|uniref:hypothetical protein n=1 Tax=Winogradskyella undariae TaxID=1285465 RepID=UPI0015CEC0E2|nr:hypothetical protein [Winogradskyella undariae]